MKGQFQSTWSTIKLYSCQTYFTSIRSCLTRFMSHIQKIHLNSKSGCKYDQIQGIMGTVIKTHIRIIDETVSSNNLSGVMTKTFIRIPHSRIKIVDLNSTNRVLFALPQLSLISYKGKRRLIRSFGADIGYQCTACETQFNRTM
jgi:hypothetical protein